MRRYLLFLFTFLIFLPFSYAQSWEKLITDGGSTGNEIVSDMDVDDEGNIYVVGTFSGTISFGNTILNSNGNTDFYVAKYDSSGAVIYAVNYGSSAGDFGNAIVVDDSGNVYITGQFDQSYLIGGAVLLCSGPTDIFTVKLNSTGNVVWAKSAGAPFNIYGDPFRDRGLDIALDNSNGVYISGVHGGQSMSFGSLTLTSGGGVGSSSIDFVGKYNTNGVEQWIVNASIGANFSNNGLAYVLEYNPISNSMIVAGENRIGLSIGPGGQTRFSQIYMRQIQLNGTFGWYREIAGGGQSIPEDLSVASNGDIYLTGYYNGTLSYPGTNTVLVSLNNGQDQTLNDAFILKFNSSASSLIYAKSIVGNQNVESRGIYLDQSDAVYVAGLFNGAPTIDNIPLGSSGLSDVFLIRLAAAGTVDWIETAGGADEDLATSIYVRNDDKVILSGGFTGTAKFGNQFVNSLGFSDIFIAQIDCKPNIPPIYNGSTQVCLGDTSIYSIPNKVGTEYLWSLSSGGSLDTTGGLVKVIWTAPGNHVLSATPSNVCGIGETRNQIINVNDVPNPPAVAGDTAICVGLGTYNIINPTSQSYQWTLSGGGNLVPLNTQALVSWAGPGNYTLTATGTNECGLGIGNALNISVSQFPISSSLISGSTTVCTGPSTYTVDKQLGTNYAWSVTGGGSLTANDTSATINWATPGTYIVRVTPSNVCGSATASSLIVNVIAQPGSVNILGDTLACTGPSSYNLPILSNGLYNWTLSGGGNLVNLGNNIIVNWSTPGNYFITASEQNACGVGIKDTIFVTVRTNAAQSGPINGNAQVCLGTELYNVGAQTDQTYTWSLSSGGTLNFVNNQASVNWTTTGTHTLSVTAANDCGQGQTRNLVVEVRGLPDQPGVVFGNDEVCLGLENYNVFAQSGLTYNWSIDGGGQLFPSNNSVSVNWTSDGNYNLSVNATNQCGSGIPRILPIEVNSTPANITDIDGIDTVCLGSQIYSIVNPQNDNDISYNWSLSGGGTILPNGNAATVNWSTPGTYTLTVRPQNSCGFGQQFSKLVFVRNTNAQVNLISGDDEVCLDTAAYTVPLIGGFVYNWNLNGGGTLNATGNTAEVIWQNTGNFTLSVATSDGCTKTLPITVKDIPTAPVSIGGDTLTCFGSKSYAISSKAGETYNWSLGSGGNLSPFNNAAIVNWNAVGQHNLQVSASNFCGTGPSENLNVNVITVPLAPQISLGDTLVCKGENLNYQVVDRAFQSFTWSLDRGGLITPNDTIVSVNWLDTGLATLRVRASNICGTGPFENIEVYVNDVPSRPSIIGDLQVCLDTSNYSSALLNNVNYSWNLNNGGILSPNQNQAQIIWTDTGTYQLSLELSNTCGNSPIKTLDIEVFDLPVAPELTQGDTVVCLGLNAYSVEKIIGETYSWSISGGGSITALDNAATINWTSTGFRQIYVTATNLCGVGPTDTIDVEVRSIPAQPSVIAGDAAVCLDSRSYNVIPTANVQYSWTLNNNGNLISGDTASAQVDWTNTGIAVLSVSASNLCGTGSSRNLSVSIADIPTAPNFIQGDTLTCLGQEVYGVAASSGLSYNWTLNNGGTITTNNSQATVNWTQTGNWEIISSLSNYCGTGPEDTLSVRIKTLPQPISFINPDTLVCLGNTVYQVNAEPEVTYNWSLNGGGTFSFVNNQAFVTWNNPGTYTITASTQNICGSGPNVSKQINVNAVPTAPTFVNPDTLACVGAEVYTAQPIVGSDFIWSISGGGGASSNGNIYNVNWTSTGSQTVSVRAFNFCGTGPISELDVDINTIPAPPQLLSGDSSVCIGNETYEVANQNDVTYNWSLNSGGSLSPNGNTANVNWTVSGSYILNLRTENYCGLSPELSIPIIVQDVPQRPQGLTGNTSICLGDTANYNVVTVSTYNYIWQIQDGPVLDSDSGSVNIVWPEKGGQTILVSAENECGLSTVTDLNVNVRDVPELQGSIIGLDKICLGSSVDYSVSDLAGVNYFWVLSDGGQLSAQSNSATVNWNRGGSYNLSVNASNSCGIADALVSTVIVDTLPSKAEIFVVNDTLFSNSQIDNIWYLNGDVFEDSGIDFIVPSQTGRYTVRIANACADGPLSDFVSYYDGNNLASETYLIPNPANVNVRVLLPANTRISDIEIFNSRGQSEKSAENINANETSLLVNDLNPGIYYVHIRTSADETVIKKLAVY